jgi:hypothetical protein
MRRKKIVSPELWNCDAHLGPAPLNGPAAIIWLSLQVTLNGRHSVYFSTTVIVGLVLVLLIKTSLLPEIRTAVVPLPTLPTPFAWKA